MPDPLESSRMHAAVHHIAFVLGLLAALAAVPLFIELLVLSLAAFVSPPVPPLQQKLESARLAAVVPAHNEEKLVGDCVRSLLASDPAATVFVVAHNCDDATALRAQDAGATPLVLNDGLGGKGRALHFGFTHALASGAKAVVVVDADSVVTPNLLPALAARFAAGASALQCRYQVSGASTPRTRLAALAFLGMNVLRPRGRHRLGLSCGIFGNGFALAAETLRHVPYTANSLVEDLEYHLHLLRAGLHVDFVDEAAVLGEMPEASAAAATQRARWEGGRILMRRQWAGSLALQVISGRLQMLEPLLDLLAFPLATEAALLAAALALGAVCHSAVLEGFSALGLLTLVLYVAVAASLAPQPAESLRAVAAAPAFLFWKILQIPRTRRAARADAAWVRTGRN
jgi:cellulose synthase/poly-beta-1,6-N-acetylglucosamine synthase-like glycosyltransferase